MKRYLVTGGAGFIGSHLCERLIENGHSVRVLDNLSTGSRENLAGILSHPGMELIEGDIRNMADLGSAMEGVEGVFHLGAMVSVPYSVENPRLSLEVNAGGTFNVLESARDFGIQRVIFASSSAVYGDNQSLPLSEDERPKPFSPYGLDKWYGEQIGRVFYEQFALKYIGLRFFNVYGPRQDPSNPYSGVITKFLDCLRADIRPNIFGDGEQTRDFVHVADVTWACQAAMMAEQGGFAVYNVASGKSVSIKKLFEMLRENAGSSIEPEHMEERQGDVRHTLGDISRIGAALNYCPQVDLKSGLLQLMADFEDE